MKPLIFVVLFALVLPAFAVMPGASQTTPYVGQRAYALVMNGYGFNGFSYPDTPLLEAYVGENLLFAITVPASAEAHVFHLHGHPWYDPSQSRFIDAKLLNPGDVHHFEVTAGGLGLNAGDWMYHCHLDAHFAHGMWGILRVYPYAMAATGSAPSFAMHLHRLGEPVTGATFEATLDGVTILVVAHELGHGDYALSVPVGLSGDLVLTAHAALGSSVYRTTLTPGAPVLPSADAVRAASDVQTAVHALGA